MARRTRRLEPPQDGKGCVFVCLLSLLLLKWGCSHWIWLDQGQQKILQKEHFPEFLTQGKDQEGLEERFINSFIGRGVFTTKFFSRGDFLLEYRGELITGDEGSKREDSYNPDLGSFLFFFKDGFKCLCVDATFSSGLGRLVNDASPNKPNCNCVMRKIKAETKTYLALYALRDIAIGEELRYDYGVKDLPWRNIKVNKKTDDKVEGNLQNNAKHACRADEEESLKSETFAGTANEGSGKDKKEASVNSETFAHSVYEASEKDKADVPENSEAFVCLVEDASGKDMPENSEAFVCLMEDALGKEIYKKEASVNSETFACLVDEASEKDAADVSKNSEAVCSMEETSGKDAEDVSENSEAFVCSVQEMSRKGKHEVPVNSKTVAYTTENGSGKVFARKRPQDGSSDKENENLVAIANKNSRRKVKAIILETDSEEEENDSPSTGANCDSSIRRQIQSTEMKDEKAVARKPSHDRCNDKEKTSLERSKNVALEKKSGNEQEADASGKREVKTEGDEEVVISCSKKGENDARIYDKRHCCFYCDKMCAKIARHYEHHHKDEAEVAEAFAYPRGSKDRKKALEKLRLRGNFHHNLRVLECKKGQLIVMRRPGEDEDCCEQITVGSWVSLTFWNLQSFPQ